MARATDLALPPSPSPSPSQASAPIRSGGGRPRRNRRLGVAAIVVSATLMGFAGVFGRAASPSGAVLGEALTLGRMLCGAGGIAVLLAVTGRLGQLRRVRLSWSVVLGGVFLGLSLTTYLSATVLTELARAVALHYLGPVVAIVLARVLLGERLARSETVSAAVSLLGMLLVAGLVDGASSAGMTDQLLGDCLAAVSGLLYGLAMLCYRYRGDMPADVRSLWNFVFGAAAVAGMVLLTRPDVSAMTPENWAWAAGLFVVCGLGALGLLVLAGAHLRAVELSALSYWEVVVAMMLGVVIYGEQATALAGLGALLVVGAAVVLLCHGHGHDVGGRSPAQPRGVTDPVK